MHVSKPLLAALASALAACGGGGDGGGTTPPVSDVVSTVTLSQSTATLRPTEARTITATPKNSSGATLNGKTVAWSVSQTGNVVSIVPSGASVQITATTVGTAQVTATVDQKSASAAITVTNQAFPASADITVNNNLFSPDAVDVAVGAMVTWSWAQGAADHNVTFGNGPAAITAISQRNSGSDSRTFTVAGTYSYSCTLHSGMNGSVVVH